ncbi:hypothetical protein SNE40_017064 [Patella caerulea]|uniref:Uncharacterized protein n=1 Tax=Patella caerulea TaxID=87958 RepID=A0AAN8PKT0_PATCE
MKLLVVIVCALVAETWGGGPTCSGCTEEMIAMMCTDDETTADCERYYKPTGCDCCGQCAIEEGKPCGPISNRCVTGSTCVFPEDPTGKHRNDFTHWGKCTKK